MNHHGSPRRRSVTGLLTLLLGVLGLCLVGGTASADTRSTQPPPGGAYLGALLDQSVDSPTAYRNRLGLAPAVYGYAVPVPLDDAEVEDLAATLRAVDDEGAGLLLTLRPNRPLRSMDEAAVADLVDRLAKAGVGRSIPVWLRPMPEMNAPWEIWGQQPTAYVRAFQRIAASVHARLRNTAVVWQPANGAGYPFTGSARTADANTGRAEDRALDTDADGRLTSDDDPYGPYWPGAEAVDWVGLAAVHYGSSFPFTRNERPPTGRLVAQLTGRFGYPDDRHHRQRDFYDRYVTRTGKPMVLQTGALYLPQRGGASELAVKRAWFDEVRAVVDSPRYSGIAMVLWQEVRRREDATSGLVADWRATHDRALATAFRNRLVRGSGLTTGPTGRSTSSVRPPTAAGQDGTSGTVVGGTTALLATLAVAVAAVAVIALAGSRAGGRWTYPGEDAGRDLRIDLLRGVAICFVVIDHVNIPSLWQLLTQELIGPISGAELFVGLSGVVLGVVYGRRVTDREQWYDGATRMWRRAVKLWVTALVVITLVYLLALLPGIDARVATTFVDQTGSGSSGRVHDLYGGFSSLADFPVPGWAMRDVLLLRMGPSQINVMGLYVLLLLLAPLMTWLLLRGRWAVLAAVSVALYVIGQLHPIRVLPSQFEDPFPLLDWQVLFVLGLLAGWHRGRLVSAARRPLGKAVVALVIAMAVAFALFSWNNPHLSNRYDVRLALMPDATFTRLYDGWFARTTLEPGRLLAVTCFLVAAYAALTVFWRPIQRALGWFLIPLGQATLYIFVLHVLFVVAVANVPVLSSSVLLGTLTHTVILALFWVMVRRRFLFGVVPR